MSILLLLFISIMQFVIQLTLYLTSVFFIYKLIHLLVKSISFVVGRSQDSYNRITVFFLLVYNIGITCLVLWCTGVGAYAGISNLFASSFLGIVMYLQFRKGGKYYLEYKKRNRLQEIKEKLNNCLNSDDIELLKKKALDVLETSKNAVNKKFNQLKCILNKRSKYENRK